MFLRKRSSNVRSFDSLVLRMAECRARTLRQPSWYKPRTARNVGLLEHPLNPMHDSSKMSPFLAVGAISARWFYCMLARNDSGTMAASKAPRLGSAADQLLFREMWYAAASVEPRFWSNSNTNGWWTARLPVAGPPPGTRLVWKKAPSRVWRWTQGTMKKSWSDANTCMKQLRTNGWLHHLARHLVADVLCLGKLRQHFLYGVLWFRATLIDHDAVINRANWYWLSASAFSTKQARGIHYKPDDYIARGAQKFKQKVALCPHNKKHGRMGAK